MAKNKGIERELIPIHIAVIMDGNGRWAEKNKLPRIMGHQEGLKSVRRIIKAADEKGVKFLTLYSFSTENWKRPETEVKFLFTLMEKNLQKESQGLHKKNVRVRFIGRRDSLPKSLIKTMSDIEKLTLQNSGLNLVLAINYGGRQEISEAISKLLASKSSPEEINEEVISKNLYTAGLPDPDLIIRTSGEQRISNFLL